MPVFETSNCFDEVLKLAQLCLNCLNNIRSLVKFIEYPVENKKSLQSVFPRLDFNLDYMNGESESDDVNRFLSISPEGN